jgi:hypothetical protein
MQLSVEAYSATFAPLPTELPAWPGGSSGCLGAGQDRSRNGHH